MAITSGGCNVFGFLLKDPETIYCIDINLAQSYLLKLKMAAIKTLDFEDFICFSGLLLHKDRLNLFEKIKSFSINFEINNGLEAIPFYTSNSH